MLKTKLLLFSMFTVFFLEAQDKTISIAIGGYDPDGSYSYLKSDSPTLGTVVLNFGSLMAYKVSVGIPIFKKDSHFICLNLQAAYNRTKSDMVYNAIYLNPSVREQQAYKLENAGVGIGLNYSPYLFHSRFQAMLGINGYFTVYNGKAKDFTLAKKHTNFLDADDRPQFPKSYFTYEWGLKYNITKKMRVYYVRGYSFTKTYQILNDLPKRFFQAWLRI